MDLPTRFTLNNGATVPAVGFGTFQGEDGNSKVKDVVKLALKLGYRHIDGANAYGNEKEIGEAIKESGIPRAEIFVTSKLYEGSESRRRRSRVTDGNLQSANLARAGRCGASARRFLKRSPVGIQ